MQVVFTPSFLYVWNQVPLKNLLTVVFPQDSLLVRKQRLINRKGHRHAANEGMEVIDRLSIIWKSDLIDKMKRSFFQATDVSILLYGCTTWTLTKRLEKKLDDNYTRMLQAIQVLAATPHKAPTIRPPASHPENYPS